MAPTQSGSNQPSSVPKSPEGEDKSRESQAETAQDQPTDPSVTKIFESTVSDSDKITDPAIEGHF
jgi:hypothetical protein